MRSRSISILFSVVLCCAFSASGTVFLKAVNYPVGSEPTSIAVGDFNEDGNLDLAVTNSNQHNTGNSSISILLGIGDGTFGTAISFPAGPKPFAVGVGDFNEDGHLDLAVALASDFHRRMTIFLGDGHSNFSLPMSYRMTEGSDSVSVADVNGDGHLDIVMGVDFLFQARVSVALGQGDGSFANPKSYNPQPDLNTRQATLADVNGDGILDILLASTGKDGSQGGISFLQGNGDGTFNRGWTLRDGQEPFAVAFADLNPGDGTNAYPDLIAADITGNSVTVRLGNQDGTFQPTQTYPAGISPRGLVVDFIDHDGNRDAVTANADSNDITFLKGNGLGGFSAPLRFIAGKSPQSITEADFNHDGRPDVAVPDLGSDEISIFLNAAQ